MPAEDGMARRLYKSERDRKICGVCGGVAAYFGIDSTIVRILTVIAAFFFGTSILVYIIAAIVMPEEGEVC